MAIDFPDSNLSLNQIFTDPTSGKNWIWDGEKWMSYTNPTPNLFLVPTGVIIAWSTNTAPAGWLMCNGNSYLRSEYTALYNVILTTYGVGSSTDSTTFNVPDLRNRFVAGIGTQVGAPTWSDTLNKKGGNPDAVVVNHQHTIAHGHSGVNTFVDGGQHRHSINHGHDISTLGDDGHDHDGRFIRIVGQGGGTRDFSREWDNTAGDDYIAQSTSGSDGGHTHTFTVDGHVGSSDSLTLNGNPGHSHNLTINNSTDNSGVVANNLGVPAANANLPPYIVLNYIIKT